MDIKEFHVVLSTLSCYMSDEGIVKLERFSVLLNTLITQFSQMKEYVEAKDEVQNLKAQCEQWERVVAQSNGKLGDVGDEILKIVSDLGAIDTEPVD